jgi:hypothetical protein
MGRRKDGKDYTLGVGAILGLLMKERRPIGCFIMLIA